MQTCSLPEYLPLAGQRKTRPAGNGDLVGVYYGSLILLLNKAILPHVEVGGLAVLRPSAQNNHAIVNVTFLALVEGILGKLSNDLLDEGLSTLLEGRDTRGGAVGLQLLKQAGHVVLDVSHVALLIEIGLDELVGINKVVDSHRGRVIALLTATITRHVVVAFGPGDELGGESQDYIIFNLDGIDVGGKLVISEMPTGTERM